MVAQFKVPLIAAEIKAKAKELGADLVGIADGKVMDQYPPDPRDPRRPSDITALDADRVIVMAKRISAGTSRILPWNDRHKYYNDELAITALEETALDLVYWLEDRGYPSIIVPPTHVDPWRYRNDPKQHMTTLISLNHAAVEAGLGTLGLNLQLLTPEFGPRVILTAVMSSVECTADAPMTTALCRGPECGRCLSACPGDVIGHWDRDWPACDRYRSPHGFAQLAEHLQAIFDAPDTAKMKEIVRSETSFNLWQSILRGSGVVTGCRRCEDVCPVGEDYARLIQDAVEIIPEDSAAKHARLDDMKAAEAKGALPDAYTKQARWIGKLAKGDG